ncbi:MAG: hypothetical protein OQK73_10955 [Gammaproteobacteria bacterium]|nr:hypothetical protein [Gammaproteobacteria bacterium]
MTMPTDNELERALKTAGAMRETGTDPNFIAKSLLSCHYQQGFLLEVLRCAEVYLHSGLSEQEHRRLVLAIEHARKELLRNAKEDEPTLGI